MSWSTIFTAIVLMLMPSLAAHATSDGDPCYCDKVLVQDVFDNSSDTNLKDDALRIIDSEMESRLKQAGGGGASYMGYGGNLSFQQFKEERLKWFAKHTYEKIESEARRSLRESMSPKAITAWSGCRADCNQPGIKCLLKDWDSKSVTILFRWVPPNEVTTVTVKQTGLLGGKSTSPAVKPREALPHKVVFTGKTETSQIYLREDGQPLKVTIDVGGYTDSLTVPYPLPAMDIPMPTGALRYMGGDCPIGVAGCVTAGGPRGRAYVMGGANQIDTGLTMSYRKGATLSAWISTSMNKEGFILGDGGGSSCATGMGLFLENGLLATFGGVKGNPFPACAGAKQAFQMTSDNVRNKINDSEWHHVAATWTGMAGADTVILYIDGKEEKREKASAIIPEGSTTMKIGGNLVDLDGKGFEKFSGLIAEIAIYDRPLDSQDVWKLYCHVAQNNNCKIP